MEDGKQLENPRDNEFTGTLINSQGHSKNHSEYYDKYRQFFSRFDSQACSLWSDHHYAKMTFAKDGIIYHPESFKEPSYNLSPSPHHKRVYIANVKLGFFQFSLQILQTSQNSSSSRVKRQGKFGKIAMLTFLTDKLAIKSIQIVSRSDKMKILSCTIKQYCFYRIASALKCGPKTINYFGFDLIVFEDCIQFAMEKINYTVNMSVVMKKDLQQCLFLLHHFQIIHFDIKPTNLGYSSLHKKYIFLDFGLSEIIEQSLGTKKLIGFRGSIACCSQQMLHIFYDYQKKHYIDTYYNDIVCLQNTLDIISTNVVEDSKLSMMGSQQIGSETNDGFEEDQQGNQQASYLVIFAKYLLCCRRYKDFQEFIKRYLANEANRLLNFIEEMNSNPELQVFFTVGLKGMQNMDQYVRIQKRLSNKNRLWSNAKIRSSQEDTQQQQTFFINEQVTNICLQIDKEASYSSKEVINEILANPNLASVPKQLYFTFYIRALRFDSNISCISFQTKSQYAKIFIKFIIKSQPIDSELSQIRQTIYYLMEYSLGGSSIDWCKSNIYSILTQFIILDCNFAKLKQRFTQRVRELFTTFEQLIEHLVNIEKVQKLVLLKHRSKYPSSHILLSETINDLYSQIFSSIVKVEDNNSSKVDSIIFKLVSYSLQNKINNASFEEHNCEFEQIQDLSLRRNLSKFACSNQLYSRISCGDVNYCFKYLESMNPYFTQSIFMNSHRFLNIDLGLYELIVVMKVINNTSQLKRIGRLVLDCFGHEELYHNFKIQMLIFLSKQSNDEEIYIQYAKQIASSPFQVTHESISVQFLEIWKKIVHIDNIAIKQVVLMNVFLNKINTFLKSDARTDNFSIANTINQSHIFQLAIQFSENKQQYISSILTKLQLGFTNTNNKLLIENYRIKYLIYQSNLNLTILKIKESYEAYKALLNLADQNESIVLYSFCCKNLLMAANYLGLEKEKMYYLRVYGHLSITLCEYKGYFLHQERQLIFQTLRTLAKTGSDQQIYRFLDGISAFITHYPIEHYFVFWIKSIVLYQKYHPQYFRYERLEKYFSHKLDWQNAYLVSYYSISLISQRNIQIQSKILLRIANGLRRIDFFAQNHILNIYYQKVLKLVSHQRRKKMVILLRQSKKQLISHLQKKLRSEIRTKICKNDNNCSRQRNNLLKFCRIIRIF